jgi:hypothetical protein
VTVELGTYNGVCYTAFCQAVREQLETHCLAVDTWAGDAQASFYDETVYEDFRGFPDEHYAAFSTLLRCTFDVALLRFGDGSLDLLHFGGLHTYDAVCHDFEIWLPKISQHGVTLFHDINVRWSGFGVWQLWRELKEKYPHLEFHHCYGPGVIAVGSAPPQPVAESAGSTACRRVRVAQLHRTDRKASDVQCRRLLPGLATTRQDAAPTDPEPGRCRPR